VFSYIIKEKKVVHFEGEAHFGAVVMKAIKIIGWPNENEHARIWLNAKDHISFALLEFMNYMGSSLKGIMSTPFYNPFLAKFVEYASPKMKEPDVWLWIVEDKKTRVYTQNNMKENVVGV
jgi:hypothetical protein